MHPIIPLQGQFEGVNNDFKAGCFRRVLTQVLAGFKAGSGGF